MKIGDFCTGKELEDYLKAEPVLKSMKTKVRQMAFESTKFLKKLLCCCLNKRHEKKLHSTIEEIFSKGDREINVGLSTINEHLDVESMIKLN